MAASSLFAQIEQSLGEPIETSTSIGGGCIAKTHRIRTVSGRELFLKSGFSNSMFRSEANGLRELRKANVIGVPEVFLVDENFLLMEFIYPGTKKKNFFEDFGWSLANLHRYTASHYGFYEDNFIGATPQLNVVKGSASKIWRQFFWEYRILYQFQLAQKNGYADEKLTNGISQLEDRIEMILSGSEEPPSLLHGDLWRGNFIVGRNGEPVLIDPAVYYGHREADLAMAKLFGGFPPEFYKAYQENYPLKDGYEYRENIYMLYHVLNHLNLFGHSYYLQAIQLIYSYL